jgi:MoaA/NifB/PqqE/SkfB family radical SAM enzyme
MFYYPKFCERIIKAGANRFFISILGSSSETHDFLTRRKGSFSQVIGTIKNLKKLNQSVHSNFVFTKINFKQVSAVTKLLLKLGVDIIRFSALKVNAEAKKNESSLDIKMSNYANYLKRSLKLVAKHNAAYDTEGIPFCIIYHLDLGINADYINEIFLENIYSDGKIKREECKTCLAFSKCVGPWKEYVDKFGWSEFRLIK